MLWTDFWVIWIAQVQVLAVPSIIKAVDGRYSLKGSKQRVIDDLPNSDLLCWVLLNPWWTRTWINYKIPQYVKLIDEIPVLAPIEAVDAGPLRFGGGKMKDESQRPLNTRGCNVRCDDTRTKSDMTKLDGMVQHISARDALAGGLQCPPQQEIRFGYRYSIREYDDDEDLELRPRNSDGLLLISTRKCWCVDVASSRDQALMSDLMETSGDAQAYEAKYQAVLTTSRFSVLSFEERRKAAQQVRRSDDAQYIPPHLLESAKEVVHMPRDVITGPERRRRRAVRKTMQGQSAAAIESIVERQPSRKETRTWLGSSERQIDTSQTGGVRALQPNSLEESEPANPCVSDFSAEDASIDDERMWENALDRLVGNVFHMPDAMMTAVNADSQGQQQNPIAANNFHDWTMDSNLLDDHFLESLYGIECPGSD